MPSSVGGYGNFLNSVWQSWQQSRTQQSQQVQPSSPAEPMAAPAPTPTPALVPIVAEPVPVVAPAPEPVPVPPVFAAEVTQPVSNSTVQTAPAPFVPAPPASVAAEADTPSLLHLYHQAQAADAPVSPGIWVEAAAERGAATTPEPDSRSAAEIMARAAYGMVSEATSSRDSVLSVLGKA